MASHAKSMAEDQGRKRRRAEGFYPRSRSVTACTLCRTRKTKCDNVRPACGYCLSIQVPCVYNESRSDFSNYDLASLHIIDQMKRLEDRIEQGFGTLARASSRTELDSPQGSTWQDSGIVSLPRFSSPVVETILEWDTFDSLNLDLRGRSLALLHHLDRSDQIVEKVSELFDDTQLDGTMISAAIHNFLKNVHSKNPILEPILLISAMESCQAHGFRTDSSSALVAVACALGLLAREYTARAVRFETGPMLKARDGDGAQAAEYFCKRARVIMSVIPFSLTKIQCLFFCGVYEMYSIRPVSAWSDFSQASLQLKLHLLSKKNLSQEEFESPEGRLLQRLYWSCMQSECELANELRIKGSGLEEIRSPHAFPSPPQHLNDSDDNLDQDTLKSWMFYLSETSLRRICDDVVWSLYEELPQSWLKHISAKEAQAVRLEGRLDAWMANLPSILRVDQESPTEDNELGLHIRSRYLMCRSWIFRPFLYIIVHASPLILAQHRTELEPLAYKCLEFCMDCINDLTFHHRHHGTYYMVRIAFASALQLLAAAKAEFISMPPGWLEAVRRTLDIISSWNSGCMDLQVSMEIITTLMRQVA